MKLSIIALASFALSALAGCAVDATAPDDTDNTKQEATGQTNAALAPGGGLTPFCPEGEKRVCTLGPPPVCHCAPIVKPINHL